MRRSSVLAMLAVSLCASGCGKMGRTGMRASVGQLTSIAAEGSLVAQDLADDRTKTTFVRTYGEELSSEAEHEAEKLTDTPLDRGLGAIRTKAIVLAAAIGNAIDGLRVAPHDRRGASKAVHDLKGLSEQAMKLGKSI
jgi:hypothetical protein